MAYNTTNYESFYGGGTSSLSPDYGNFTGYRMSAAQLGFPGSPQTANQLGETVNAIKQGVKAFEVTMLMPETAEVIPTQHFQEMRALMKLSGVKPSVHGPLIDAAGFNDKGWGGEEGQADNERRMFDAIEKAHILDPKGNIPIVFHSSNGTPGAEWKPGDKSLGEDKFVMEKGSAINRETGQMIAIKREYKFRLDQPEYLEKGQVKGGPKGVLFDAEGTVGSANLGEWENKMTEIAQMNKHAEEIIGAAPINLEGYENAAIRKDGEVIVDMRTGKTLAPFNSEGRENQVEAYNKMRKAGLFLENSELSFNTAFHQAYKYGTDKQKKELKELSKEYTTAMYGDKKTLGAKQVDEKFISIYGPQKRIHILNATLEKMGEITENKMVVKDGEYVLKNGKRFKDKDYGTPQIFQETEKFAMGKASQTFGNLAMKSYDKFEENAPVIAIENMFQGMAFSRAEDMKKLVEMSRKNFIKQLISKKGIDEKKAKSIADKHLGVTWDVGHINVMKKKGFTDKDVIEQTKKIAPMVKHIHLTDNFGYADTHLAPGMGNVPIKGILEELEKTGRFDEMRKITEAGGFVQQFKKSPHPMTMAAFGSPIYGMKSAPYWNQVMDIQGSYFGGYGTVSPSQHHSMYGSGFTTMPVELGGQMPGGQSRFGGTPMA